MRCLTFSQYVSAKKQLIEHLSSERLITESYDVKKYIKLPLIDKDGVDLNFSCRPGTTIVIEWAYQEPNIYPEIRRMSVNESEYTYSNAPARLIRWLNSNATEHSGGKFIFQKDN